MENFMIGRQYKIRLRGRNDCFMPIKAANAN